MKIITFKEKSFFDEDIEIFDESNLLLAKINTQNNKKILSFENYEYYIYKAFGLLNLKAEIINARNKSDSFPIRIISNYKLSFVVDDQEYFYTLEWPMGNNFSLSDSENGSIANGSKNLLTNNGSIMCYDKISLKALLFFILIRVDRKNLRHTKFG